MNWIWIMVILIFIFIIFWILLLSSFCYAVNKSKLWFLNDKKTLKYLVASQIGIYTHGDGAVHLQIENPKGTNMIYYKRRAFCSFHIYGLGSVARWSNCHKYLTKIRGKKVKGNKNILWETAFHLELPE